MRADCKQMFQRGLHSNRHKSRVPSAKPMCIDQSCDKSLGKACQSFMNPMQHPPRRWEGSCMGYWTHFFFFCPGSTSSKSVMRALRQPPGSRSRAYSTNEGSTFSMCSSFTWGLLLLATGYWTHFFVLELTGGSWCCRGRVLYSRGCWMSHCTANAPGGGGGHIST